MWNTNGNEGARRYAEDDKDERVNHPSRPPVAIGTRDQQQMDAVEALASFSQVATIAGAGFAPQTSMAARSDPLAAVAPYVSQLQQQQPRPQNAARQYSDTSSHHSAGSSSGAGGDQHPPQYSSAARPSYLAVEQPPRAPPQGYYPSEAQPPAHRPAAYSQEGAGYHRSMYEDGGGGAGYYQQQHQSQPSTAEPTASRSDYLQPHQHAAYEDGAKSGHSHPASSSSSSYADQRRYDEFTIQQQQHPPPPSSYLRPEGVQYTSYQNEVPQQTGPGSYPSIPEHPPVLTSSSGHSAASYPSERHENGSSMSAHQLPPAEGHVKREHSFSGNGTADSSVETAAYPTVGGAPRGKPEAMAKALAASHLEEHTKNEGLEKSAAEIGASEPVPPKKKKATKKSPTKKPPSAGAKQTKSRKKVSPLSISSSALLTGSPSSRGELLLFERAPPISEAEYENLEEMMTQFCRVPLLAEFSRPVALLHPELAAVYSKIVTHSVDLGHVCRGIRRRQYKSLRDVRLDMWRVFANCVKYNSHPNNKEAVPSFVSIALHLREYFNNLWQEYMIPSDLPPPPSPQEADDDTRAAYEVLQRSYSKREKERHKRLDNSGVLVLSNAFTQKMAARLLRFVDTGGLVDKLDTVPLFGTEPGAQGPEIDLVVQRLRRYHDQMLEVVRTPQVEYTVDAFYTDLRKCYTEDVLEDNPAMRNRFCSRLDRLFWKYAIPLHEANSRGVTQSSIWGNIAAVIWARESSKKPYWPALCLGILPPPAQREGWHSAVTERNENRLPERLRMQLKVAKRRCEQAQKRQSMSYFLVEFLGTHEFIWVRETDIIENFDPEEDPNKTNLKSTSKKSRSSRSSASNVVGSQIYATALQECVWANEEYENVLQDAFEFADDDDDDEDDEDENYSFSLLAQSDDEADRDDKHGYRYEDDDDMSLSDVDEANWLLAHDGMLDTSADGRKNAKKRTQAMKKKASAAAKKDAALKESPAKKKRGTSPAKTKKEGIKKEGVKKDGTASDKKAKTVTKESKKEQRELEKRRKKRSRERDKLLRSEAKKKTKRRRSAPDDADDDERGLNHDKRARATAIVNAYLSRWAKEDDSKSLALNGVMAIPAAMVDSTGLLGMALAFRAASGELAMPDDGEEQLAKTKPWAAIDSEKPKSSAERTENLEKQIELLEMEISRIRSDTGKRKLLASEYTPKRRLAEQRIEEDNLAARHNHFKRKKKVAPAKTDQSVDDSPDKSESAGGAVDGDEKDSATLEDASPTEGGNHGQSIDVKPSNFATEETQNHHEEDAQAMEIDA